MNVTQSLTKLIHSYAPTANRTKLQINPEQTGHEQAGNNTATFTQGECPLPTGNEYTRCATGLSDSSPTLLVMDVSTSMNQRFAGARSKIEAAGLAAQSHIMERARQNPHSEIGVITFHKHAQVLCPLTPLSTGRKELIKQVRSLSAGGYTDLGNAMKCAFEQTNGQPTQIVLISDGHGGNPVPYADRLKAQGCVIDCIGIGSDPSQVDEARLRRATSITNGQPNYVFVRDLNLLTQTMTAIATITK
jgi:hypothetical protein